MRVGLKMIHISLEHYTAQIFSNKYSFFWHISHSRCTPIVYRCALQHPEIAEYTVKRTWLMGGGMRKVIFLVARRLCQSPVHPTSLTWPIFRAISKSGRCIWWLVIIEMISTVHPETTPAFWLGWFPVPRKVPKILTMLGIPQLEQCGPHSGILTQLVPAWNGIVLMDASDTVMLFWRPGSGIFWNESWLVKSHMAHAWWVKYLKVHQCCIPLFDHSITEEIRMFTLSIWTKLILMFCKHSAYIESTISSGNTLSRMSIGFGSLMDCISCSWI